jgi:hypothetical protein
VRVSERKQKKGGKIQRKKQILQCYILHLGMRDRYEGEMRDDKKHGRGIYTWPSGSRYEGDWCEDKHHGHGMKTTTIHRNSSR